MLKVTKRDGDSSLMQLREELRNYESLRKEHDTQIVQIAIEGTDMKVYENKDYLSFSYIRVFLLNIS